MTTHNVDSLISDLDSRIENDYQRMRRWRYVHRVIGLLAIVILMIVPPILAVGFISSSSTAGRILLFIITVVAGFNGLFQPLHQSYRRRSDANNDRRLLDEFRTEVAARRKEPEQLAEVYKIFSARFAKLYEERGEGLIEATIQSTGQGKVNRLRRT
jgi:hypothetical protein